MDTLAAVHDLLIVGSVFFEVFIPEMEWPAMGTETIVDSIHVGLGGSLNTASVARGLGLDVALLSPRGDGLTDRAIQSEITRLGIRSITWRAGDDGAISLVRSNKQDRSFVTAVDRECLKLCPELPPSRYVHVGGLPEAEAFAARFREARAKGAKIHLAWKRWRGSAVLRRGTCSSATPTRPRRWAPRAPKISRAAWPPR
jgi:sugar/nucleoside kinase (ribokinase family)